MPTGQVLRWQTRIMTQPETTSGAVAKPNSSAPSSAAIDDVAAGLHLAVDLDDDAAAQAVHQQHLLRLGEAELPRHAAVLDAGERRGAGAAVVARDQHDVARAPCETPAATVPTPASATSFTWMRASGLAFFRS